MAKYFTYILDAYAISMMSCPSITNAIFYTGSRHTATIAYFFIKFGWKIEKK